MNTESEIQAQILRALGSRPDVRLFRQNVGTGWVGNLINRLPNGTVILAHARPLHAGLHVGSGDLLGWTIRDARALFTSLEVKTLTGRPTADQINWRDQVLKSGGIAGIVRSVEEAVALIS